MFIRWMLFKKKMKWSNDFIDFPNGSAGKESTCNSGDTGDVGSIPGSGRSPGGVNGSPLQCSCLENPMDRGVSWATVLGVAELDTAERLTVTMIS